MAVINFVVPDINSQKFTGGLLCIFYYANGLQRLGHEVHVTSLGRSVEPQWFRREFELQKLPLGTPAGWARDGARLARSLLFERDRSAKQQVRDVWSSIMTRYGTFGTFSYQSTAMTERLRTQKGHADVTIATSFETALPVYLHGKGVRMYFMQHYEPYFAVDTDRPEFARCQAQATYDLPMSLIANSSWLAQKVIEVHGRHDVQVNLNAIDQTVFYPEGQLVDNEFVVISYGGRHAAWKGFRDAAEAIRIARRSIPQLHWKVYGDALLPPDNSIAPYEPLGFLQGADLRRAYSSAHVLLSASWYESFPLYPIEAMACGCAVVTTPFGTEDYAVSEETALVVPARRPELMAQALVRLYRDDALRRTIAQQAARTAQTFTWSRSVGELHAKITALLNRPRSL